jgi:DNA-binding beta-propeller fold protein YncE
MMKSVLRSVLGKQPLFFVFLLVFNPSAFAQSARLWVANGLAETASRVVLDSGAVANHVITLDIIPNQIVVSGNFLLAVNSGSHNIQVFNRNTLAGLGTIELGAGRNPWNLVMVDSAIGYASNLVSGTVSKFNVLTKTVLDEFPVGQSPEGITFLKGRAWVCNTGFNPNTFGYGQGELAVIDPAADSVVKKINVGTNPQAVKPTPDGKLAVICTGDFGSIGGSVYLIDPANEIVMDSILTGGTPSTAAINFNNIAYLPAGGFAGSGLVFKVNLNTKTVERGPGNPILVGTGATDAVYDVDSGYVYVACFSDGTVRKISGADAVVGSFTVGDGPLSLDVGYPFRIGDLNGDGQETSADAVLELNCVFLGCSPPPRLSQTDMNGDGLLTSSDVVCHLNRVFLGARLPCR